ncbi:MAG: Calx-beta domain-containing protein [Bacteroidota bacterium]
MGVSSNRACGVVIVDLDGDGRSEVITSGVSLTTINVHRNISTGPGNISCAPPTAFNTRGNSPYRIISGDYDGDGRADLATCDWIGNFVSVLLNRSTGPGNLNFQLNFYSTIRPYRIAQDDVDGDGDVDIITQRQGNPTVTILTNNGNGLFTPFAFNSGSNNIGVAAGDLDGDLVPEIIVGNLSNSGGFRAHTVNAACNQAPTAMCANFTVDADVNCGATIIPADIDDGSNDPDGDPITFSLDDAGPFGIGMHTVTLSVSDGTLTDFCTATVTVEDNTPPMLACANATINLEATGTADLMLDDEEIEIFAEDFSTDPPGGTNLEMLANWTVTNCGNVDVTDIAGILGQEVELAGTANATIETMQNFSLVPGDYMLEFSYVSTNATNQFDVTIGSVFSQSYTPTNVVQNASESFTVTVGTDATIIFSETGTDDASGSQIGAIRLIRLVEMRPDELLSSVSDNCGIQSYMVSESSFDCDDVGAGPVTITVTVTDVGGNVVTCESMVTVTDDPVIPALDTITGECSATVTAPTTTNNCAGTITGTTTDPVVYNTQGTFTVTWTFDDGNGNSIDVNQTVIVDDVTPPVINCPADITLECDASTDPAATGVATATDNCDNSPTITFSDGAPAVEVLTSNISFGASSALSDNFLAAGANSFTTAGAAFIMTHLSLAGRFVNGGDLTDVQFSLNADDSGDPIVPGTQIVIFDAVVPALGANQIRLTPAGGSVTLAPNTTYWIVMTDLSMDNSAGVFWSVAESNMEIGAGSIGDVLSQTTNGTDWSTPGNRREAVFQIENERMFVAPQVDQIERTWTATDASGNSTTCVQLITLEDNTPPTFVCPDDQTVDLNADCELIIPDLTTSLTVNDNCLATAAQLPTATSVVQNLVDGNTETVTITATDEGGNTNTTPCTVTLTARAPEITVAGNSTEITNGDDSPAAADGTDFGSQLANTNTDRTFTITNDGSLPLTLTGTAPNFVTISGATEFSMLTQPSNGMIAPGASVSFVVRFTPTANGSFTATVSVASNECNEDPYTFDVFGELNCTITIDEVNITDEVCPGDADGQIEVVATGMNLTGALQYSINGVDYQSSNIFGGLADGTYTVTVRDAGNTSCNTERTGVTIAPGTDAEDPNAICQDITVFLDADGQASITALDVDGGSTDNCAVTDRSVSTTDFGCRTAEFALDFDGQNDHLSLPDDIVSGLNDFTFETLIDYRPSGNWARIFDIGINQTFNMFLTTQAGRSPNFTRPRFAITVSGNNNEQIIDSSIPMPTGWNHIALTLDENPVTGTVVGTMYINGNVVGTNNNMTLTPGDLGVTNNNLLARSQYPDPFLNATLDETRIWSVARTQSQLQAFSNQALSGNEPGLFLYYNYEDGPGSTMVTDLSPSGNDGTLVNMAPANDFITSVVTASDDVGVQQVTLTVGDLSGNTDACTANVTVQDTISPTIICRDITVALDATGMVNVTSDQLVTSSSDNCEIDAIVLSQTNFACADLGANPITVTITDVNGNSNNCAPTVTVEDNMAPTFTCPSDRTIDLDANCVLIVPDFIMGLTAMDNCSATFTQSPMANTAVQNLEDGDTRVVTVTATDPAGNTNITACEVTLAANNRGTVAINDVTMDEGDAGTTTLTFTVTLTNPGCAFSVDYATANDGAIAGDDYDATSGTLNFAAGETSQTVAVTVNSDLVVEADEAFFVNLSNPTNGVAITDGQGRGIITNDDVASFAIADVTLDEGDAGTTGFTFTVTLTGDIDQGYSIDYATSDGTATTADSDYNATTGTLNFVGNDGETQTFTVEVNGDMTVEADEAFNIALSNLQAAGTGGTNVSIADDAAVGNITNDDVAELNIADVSDDEANGPFNFVVSLTNPLDVNVTFEVTTTDGTAITTDGDYVGQTNESYTIMAGQTMVNVPVVITDDILNELDENFTVALSNAAGSPSLSIGDGLATGTIVNDDFINLSISDASLVEGNAGQSAMNFTVSLDGTSSQTVTVSYATADGSATTIDNDYVSASGNVIFSPGQMMQTITVQLLGDLRVEGDQQFTVNLSNPTIAGITDGQGQGTITNDDMGTIVIDVNGNTVIEGDAGNTPLAIPVSLVGGPVDVDVTVNYTINDGTATVADNDYADAASGSVVIPAEANGVDIVVNVIGDTNNEDDEQFTVTITSLDPMGRDVLLGDVTAAGNIIDDDFVCPTIGTLAGEGFICQGETRTLTASGLATMPEAENNGEDFGIRFVYFAAPTADPYTGGTDLGAVAFQDLESGNTEAIFDATFPMITGDITVYAVLSPTPEEASCRPFQELDVQLLSCGVTNDDDNFPMIADPCVCKNNATTLIDGQFDELVEVLDAPAGETWTVTQISDLFDSNSPAPPAAPLAIPIGTVLTEQPTGTPGVSNYFITGVHVDDIGYSIMVSNGITTLGISNRCWYPNPSFSNLASSYCRTNPNVTLMGTAQLGDGTGEATPELETFVVIRVANNETVVNDTEGNAVLDIATLPAGRYRVIYTFDAADDDPDANHPGCSQSIEREFEILEVNCGTFPWGGN